ncbi:hypothetical protein K461DRAFT_309532 [Myriangium duriaei CBS 260.36]|uniref:Mid2 domain-containing protein n=1 Tax=Myriangium duriaei CBS 260.36 TaxID=1168546 RepID=A0A9P4JC70_9PEZI|nr:hypothetical protein K461DRAFT_309532 [Myriangium duriaei CBS 260.36]
MILTIGILSLFPQLVSFAFGAGTCYSPSGWNMTDKADMSPCNAGAAVSHCCARIDLCLSNGYCFSQGPIWHSRLYRGGCTNKSWGPQCPQQCNDVGVNGLGNIGLGLNQAGGFFCCVTDGKYVTENSSCQVSTGGSNQPFAITPGQAIYDRSTGATTNNLSAPSLVSSNQTTTADTKSPPVSDSSSNHMIAIVAGISVPLGVASLIMLGLVLWERKKRMAVEARLQPMGHIKESHSQSHRQKGQDLSSSNTIFEMANTGGASELDAARRS